MATVHTLLLCAAVASAPFGGNPGYRDTHSQTSSSVYVPKTKVVPLHPSFDFPPRRSEGSTVTTADPDNIVAKLNNDVVRSAKPPGSGLLNSGFQLGNRSQTSANSSNDPIGRGTRTISGGPSTSSNGQKRDGRYSPGFDSKKFQDSTLERPKLPSSGLSGNRLSGNRLSGNRLTGNEDFQLRNSSSDRLAGSTPSLDRIQSGAADGSNTLGQMGNQLGNQMKNQLGNAKDSMNTLGNTLGNRLQESTNAAATQIGNGSAGAGQSAVDAARSAAGLRPGESFGDIPNSLRANLAAGQGNSTRNPYNGKTSLASGGYGQGEAPLWPKPSGYVKLAEGEKIGDRRPLDIEAQYGVAIVKNGTYYNEENRFFKTDEVLDLVSKAYGEDLAVEIDPRGDNSPRLERWRLAAKAARDLEGPQRPQNLARSQNSLRNQTLGNQTLGNQTLGNQTLGNSLSDRMAADRMSAQDFANQGYGHGKFGNGNQFGNGNIDPYGQRSGQDPYQQNPSNYPPTDRFANAQGNLPGSLAGGRSATGRLAGYDPQDDPRRSNLRRDDLRQRDPAFDSLYPRGSLTDRESDELTKAARLLLAEKEALEKEKADMKLRETIKAELARNRQQSGYADSGDARTRRIGAEYGNAPSANDIRSPSDRRTDGTLVNTRGNETGINDALAEPKSYTPTPLINGLLLFSGIANCYLFIWLRNIRVRYKDLVATKRMAEAA